MSNKLKKIFCYSTSPIGKLSELIAKAVVNTAITVDVRGVDEFNTYCWCCNLWRGILIGGVLGLVVGVLIG